MSMVADRQADEAGISIDRHGDWARIAVVGELYLTRTPTLDDYVAQAIASRVPPQVMVDASKMTFCDSSGLNSFLRARKRIADLGGKLVLVRPTDRFTRILKTTGLDAVFDIRDELPA